MATGANPFPTAGEIPPHITSGFRIALLRTAWNGVIADRLEEGARSVLRKAAVQHLATYTVPGAFELPQLAAQLAHTVEPDAIICLGCILKGETRHDEYIAQAVANGLTRVALDHFLPVVFGVLTVNTLVQAEERAGGILGNKGAEAAHTALQMLALRRNLIPTWQKP